jgi:hypothetical protein
MLDLIYWLIGVITWGVFLWFLVLWIAKFGIWFNVNFWITDDAKKLKLIKDQMKDIFSWYFVDFDERNKLLTLSKSVLKDSSKINLTTWVKNLRDMYFPFSPVYCYETQENIFIVFSSKMDEMDLGLYLL